MHDAGASELTGECVHALAQLSREVEGLQGIQVLDGAVS